MLRTEDFPFFPRWKKRAREKETKGSSLSVYTGVVDVEHENVRGSNLGELVHRGSNLLLLYHGADSHPAFLLELRYCRCPLAGCDGSSLAEVGSGYVVLAQNILLRRDDTPDAGGDEIEHLWVGGPF